MCTKKRAIIVVCVLPIFAILKNVHLFYTRGRQVIPNPDLSEEELTVKYCGFPTPATEFFEIYIRIWIAFSLYAFIPICSVFVLNVLIMYTIWKIRKISSQSSRGQWIKKSNNQMTAMFLSVSFTFLILATPNMIVAVIKPYLKLSYTQSMSYAYIETVIHAMAYLMHSSNFFLYCLTGPGFRRELKLMVNNWFGRNTSRNKAAVSDPVPAVALLSNFDLPRTDNVCIGNIEEATSCI